MSSFADLSLVRDERRRVAGAVTRITAISVPLMESAAGSQPTDTAPNRRTHTRLHGAQIHGEAEPDDGSSIFAVEVVDFTHMGMLMRAPQVPDMGTHLRLRLDLISELGVKNTVKLEAEVVRHLVQDGEILTGLRLIDADPPSDLKSLDEFYLEQYFVQTD
jgi:hypothetical protein